MCDSDFASLSLALSLALSLSTMSGCADEHPGTEFAIRWPRDYSDVPVIQNSQSAPPVGRQTMVSAEPYARIGEESGGDLTVIAHVKRLSTGEIVILDSVNRSIVVFDPRGRLVRRIERIGDGPGEFRNVRGLRVLQGDTLLVFAPPDRLIRMRPDGGYIGQQMLAHPRESRNTASSPAAEQFRSWYPSQPLSNGKVLVQSGSYQPNRFISGYSRSIRLYSLGRPGQHVVLDTIGWFPGNRTHRLNEREVRAVHFSPMTIAAVGTNYLYLGDGATYEIGQYDLNGKLLRRMRRHGEALRVTEDERRYLRDHLLSAGVPAWNVEVTDVHPFFDLLIVDDRDYVWARQPHAAYRTSQLWAVFDTTGRLVEEVTMPFPATRRVMWIDSASVLAQSNTGLTPELLMFRITRTDSVPKR